MTETRLPSDLIDLLSVFADTGVEYLLIGGQALALLGLPRFTKDADIWLRDTPDNLAKTVRALAEFGAPQALTEALLTADPLDVVWMGAPPARIDLMTGVPGGDFERAWRWYRAPGEAFYCRGAVPASCGRYSVGHSARTTLPELFWMVSRPPSKTSLVPPVVSELHSSVPFKITAKSPWLRISA
jgi:hypothetical protein